MRALRMAARAVIAGGVIVLTAASPQLSTASSGARDLEVEPPVGRSDVIGRSDVKGQQLAPDRGRGQKVTQQAYPRLGQEVAAPARVAAPPPAHRRKPEVLETGPVRVCAAEHLFTAYAAAELIVAAVSTAASEGITTAVLLSRAIGFVAAAYSDLECVTDAWQRARRIRETDGTHPLFERIFGTLTR